MSVAKAIKAYNSEKLNCAQSVLRAFQEDFEIEDGCIADAAKLGGGRAGNGLCGALHAAECLSPDEEAKVSIHQRFASEAGSDRCRKIRKLGRLSCGECVETAAGLLTEFVPKSPVAISTRSLKKSNQEV